MSELTDAWVRKRIADMEQTLHRLHFVIYDKVVVDRLWEAVVYNDTIPAEISNCFIKLQAELNSFKQVFKDD